MVITKATAKEATVPVTVWATDVETTVTRAAMVADMDKAMAATVTTKVDTTETAVTESTGATEESEIFHDS